MLSYVLCLLIGVVYPNHDFHTSWMTLNYSESDKQFEVEWKTDTEHLEFALSQFSEKEIRFDEADANQYLSIMQAFVESDAKLKLNGKIQELEVSEIQVDYAEIVIRFVPLKCKRKLRQIGMENTLLIDHFPGQKNMVQWNYKGQKVSHLFQFGKTSFTHQL